MRPLIVIIALAIAINGVTGQYDFGQGRNGERRGSLRPEEIAGITLGVIFGVVALLIALSFCYYVRKKQIQVQKYGPYTPPLDDHGYNKRGP